MVYLLTLLIPKITGRRQIDLLMTSGQKRMLNEIECIYWVIIRSLHEKMPV